MTNPAPQDHQNGSVSYTIAIGASAGGLEALKSFFDALPPNCPHSFVIIQHLSPDYKSLMSELLAKNTPMPIQEVTDNMPVHPGRIYLIPPKSNMMIESGNLTLTDKPSGHGLNLPIDIFFRSLAKEKGHEAIGIILTGTGSDGASGARAIKEAGGMVMVQDPEQAKFNGMPLSVVRTGLADFILPVEQLPEELLSFIEHPTTYGLSYKSIESDEVTLRRLLNHIHRVTKLDFSDYKRPTLARRIEHRMGITKCALLRDYLNFIYDYAEEAHLLAREFLIGVTHFFRDPDKWNVLEQKIVPDLVRAKAAEGKPLRVWCAGCSTGEEVYTIAILIKEEMRRQGEALEVKIFATDIAKNHLEIASRGVYPASIVADVSPERLRAYFTCHGDEYHVMESLRKMVIYSLHNILQDPPFSNIDIVVCRNLLIYLQPRAQTKAMSSLHYALKLQGVLMLGSSETPGELKHGFEEFDAKAKLYRNLQVSRTLDMGLMNNPNIRRSSSKGGAAGRRGMDHHWAVVMNEAMVDELGLASVFVDDNFDILHAVGEVRRFIGLPDKGFSINLLKMLPDNIAITVSAAVRKAILQQDKVLCKGLRVIQDQEASMLDVLVQPFQVDTENGYSCCMIAFIPLDIEQSDSVIIDADSENQYNQNMTEMERELQETRENLQATIEELETTNEELLAANEELQSTNEELQSMNEELHTVNTEHQHKIEDLAALNADIDNLLKSTEIGTIFLDCDMRIRKITPAIQEQFNLLDSDVGRPISHFTSNFGEADNRAILDNAQNVLARSLPYSKEVYTRDGKWYLMKIAPFRNGDGAVDGVVISFVDVTALQEAQDKYARQNAAFEQVLEGTMAGYWDWMIQEGVEYMSPTLKKMLGYEDHEIDNVPEAWRQLIHPDDLPGVLDVFNKHVESKGAFPYHNEVRYCHKDGSIVWVYCRGKVIEWDAQGNPVRMVGSHVDITQLKAVEQSNQELTQFAYVASHDLQEPLLTITSFVDLLQQDYQEQFDENFGQCLSFISQASTRMSALIEGLLDYSRIGNDRTYDFVDCNALVSRIYEDLSFSIAEAGATFKVDQLPQLKGRETELRMLFQNLVTNAVKFRRQDTALHIRISAQKEDDQWKFAVEDNGIGIAVAYQERIFQIFQRLHTREDYEGTGIGLAHCKKIVEQHGGKIWVDSQPNQGSTFYFTISDLI